MDLQSQVVHQLMPVSVAWTDKGYSYSTLMGEYSMAGFKIVFIKHNHWLNSIESGKRTPKFHQLNFWLLKHQIDELKVSLLLLSKTNEDDWSERPYILLYQQDKSARSPWTSTGYITVTYQYHSSVVLLELFKPVSSQCFRLEKHNINGQLLKI